MAAVLSQKHSLKPKIILKQERYRKDCIFCGKSGTTKEHIWPKVIRDSVGDNIKRRGINAISQHTVVGSEVNLAAGHTRRVSHTKSRAVDPYAITLRILCNHCNNVWSRNIQEAASLTALRLLSSVSNAITATESEVFAKWIILLTICCSFDSSGDDRVSIETRRAFRDGVLPNNWNVFYRPYVGDLPSLAIDRRSQPVRFATSPISSAASADGYNIGVNQSFSIVFGSVIIYVFFREIMDFRRQQYVPTFELAEIQRRFGLTSVHPEFNTEVNAPMTDNEFAALCDEITGSSGDSFGFKRLGDKNFLDQETFRSR